jgi:phenylacetate-CoA ligase
MNYQEWLLKAYYRWRRFIPGRVLYHADYYRTLQLLDAVPALRGGVADARLRHVLSTAVRHVPFYRRHVKLTDGELANEPVTELLGRFPYTDKKRVMECQHDFLDERLNPRLLHYTTSSGSTGQGIGIWRSKRLADIEKAFFAHEWSRYGFSFDKSRYLRIGVDARALPHQPPARIVGNRLMLSPYHLTAQHKGAIVDALNRFKPEYMHAYPSCVAALADMLRPGELDFKFRALLLASEPAWPHQLAAMERLFDCPASISFGLTERTNLAFAEYKERSRSVYRFQKMYAFNENRIVGGQSEIVGTSLWNDVMPLIRYCTADYGHIAPDGACAEIEGREQEFLLDRSGKLVAALTIQINDDTWEYASNYQIRQTRPGAITIAVVPRYGAITQEQQQAILDTTIPYWGAMFDISVEVVDSIARTASGKHRFVISELLPTGR